jgi:methionyl-tRNA formyltransferase
MAEGLKLRIVFMGTPEFAVPTLRALLAGEDQVVGVVTRPDHPAGRGLALHPPPVKELALTYGLPVLQPQSLKDSETLEQLRGWQADLIVVAAYGKILPKTILSLPLYGCINVHASLLPQYRGAAPIQWAILRGEKVTGITIMQMNERMDAGEILLQKTIPIAWDDTGKTLHDKLAPLGAQMLVEAITLLKKGDLYPIPQKEEEATLAPMIKKEDGRIDWTKGAEELERVVRAFNPWPSAYTSLAGKLLKVFRARVIEEEPPPSALPATVIRSTPYELVVLTGKRLLALEEVQLEGKKRLPVDEFLKGFAIKEGTVLGG